MKNYFAILKANAVEKSPFKANPSLCPTCLWRREGGVTCDAFPKGIPVNILMGNYDHRAPFDEDGVNDGGLTYTPEP